MGYVNLIQTRKLIEEWQLTVDEPTFLVAEDIGNAFIQTCIDKHGTDAHSESVLESYATRKAAYEAAINTIDPFKGTEDLPAYLSMLSAELNRFFALKAKDFERVGATMYNFYRGGQDR